MEKLWNLEGPWPLSSYIYATYFKTTWNTIYRIAGYSPRCKFSCTNFPESPEWGHNSGKFEALSRYMTLIEFMQALYKRCMDNHGEMLKLNDHRQQKGGAIYWYTMETQPDSNKLLCRRCISWNVETQLLVYIGFNAILSTSWNVSMFICVCNFRHWSVV